MVCFFFNNNNYILLRHITAGGIKGGGFYAFEREYFQISRAFIPPRFTFLETHFIDVMLSTLKCRFITMNRLPYYNVLITSGLFKRFGLLCDVDYTTLYVPILTYRIHPG